MRTYSNAILVLLLLVLATASDDQFIQNYAGDDQLILSSQSSDDQLNYFETSLEAVVAEEAGGGGSTNNQIPVVLEEGKFIDCFTYQSSALFFAKTNNITKYDLIFTNACLMNNTFSFACEGKICSYLIYNLNQTFLTNTTTNYTLLLNITDEVLSNKLEGTLTFEEKNKISLTAHIITDFEQEIRKFLFKESFINNVPKLGALFFIFVALTVALYLLTFKLMSPLIALTLSILISLAGIIGYILINTI